MALNKTGLKSGIQTLCGKSNSAEEFATGLADLIDTYVKTATVSVTVSTTGTAAAQTGTGTGTLS